MSKIIKTYIIKGIRILLILVLFAEYTNAQQDPGFTYYNFNTQVINPAYAGTWRNLGFMTLGRLQWAGMEGAPQTFTFSVQSPVGTGKVALGLNVISDKVGFEKRMAVNADYSYRLNLTEEIYLRLGIKGGIVSYSHNLSQYTGYPGEPQDPLFMTDINNQILPNFGIGAFLNNENFYVGLSSPKILKSTFKNENSNYSSWAELRHFYLTGGLIIDVSDEIKFKPAFLTRYISGAPVAVDLTANFLIKEKVWLGGNYRVGDSFGFIGQWIFDKRLRIGYAIDFSTNRLRLSQNGSHEIMVSYELGVFRRWESPRMF